jgi:hypothetical protein
MAENSKWPLYDLGSHDHLHAIGVMIAAWNQVETVYQTFIQLIFPDHMAAGIHVYELLGNDERAKLIRAHLPSIATNEEFGLVDHFLTYANICRVYRNILAHSGYANQPPDDLIRLTRGSSKDRKTLTSVQFSVAGIREMADTTYIAAQFGFAVWSAIQLRLSNESWAAKGVVPQFSLSLPEKPPLPRSWDQIRANPKPAQPPPQSSPE